MYETLRLKDMEHIPLPPDVLDHIYPLFTTVLITYKDTSTGEVTYRWEDIPYTIRTEDA
jgi:hypothetical protein